MMKVVDTLLAKIALMSAQSATGSASLWTAYQPKEPDMKKVSK